MFMATSPVTFLKEARTELGKVVWPKRNETVKLTAVVIGISVGVGVFIGLLDIIFTKLAELLLK